MTGDRNISGLLADLQKITEISGAGLLSKSEQRLEPGERRSVAILMLDIVGYSKLVKCLTPEQIAALIDRAFRIFELTVNDHGGYCDKVIGDAALYVFPGHPNYQPVCEAALRAGLKLQQRASQISTSLTAIGLGLQVRIGASYGEVARQPVGQSKAQVTVMGETVNVAKRLESVAGPGTVLTTIRVLEKAGDVFSYRKCGKLELKGIGPVTTYEISGVEEPVVQLRGAFRRLTPLVGRTREIRGIRKTIRGWWRTKYSRASLDSGRTGREYSLRNRLLIVCGDTAIGKSRLAWELIEGLQAMPGIVQATAHCNLHAGIAGFSGELVRIAGIDATNLVQRWNQLCSKAATVVSRDYADRQLRHLPTLAYVLGCHEVDTSGIEVADPVSFELACRLAVRSSIELAAHEAGQPAVIVIEDLQWMGQLKSLVKSILEQVCLTRPLTVLATARPEYWHIKGSLGEGESTTWKLDPLDQTEIRKMIKALLPGLRLPKGFVGELEEKSAGLPYYIEEFTRMLVQRGVVRESGGRYQPVGKLADLAIPEGIRTLVMGRLDQLPSEHRELAKRASVLGRDFRLEVLEPMETRLGFDHPGHPLDDLSNLVNHHILGQEHENTYYFEHILLQQAAYNSLLNNNRLLLHNVAAEAYAAKHVPGTAGELEVLRELIRHLSVGERQAEVHRYACDYLMLLAQTGRFDDWDKWETLATECWEVLLTAGECPDESPLLLRAQAARQWRMGETDQAMNLFLQALAAATTASDSTCEARVWSGLGILYSSQGRAREAFESYSQSLELFRENSMPAEEARVLGNIGNLHQRQGHLDQALTAYEAALTISREVGDRRCEGMILMYMGVMQSEQGHRVQALECFNLSRDLARKVGNRIGESAAYTNIGAQYSREGQIEKALACFRKSLEIDREIGDRLGEGYNLFNQGDLLLQQNKLHQAADLLDAALDCFSSVSNPLGEGMVLAGLGEVNLKLGRDAEAGRFLNQALDLLGSEADSVRLGLLHCQRVRYFFNVDDPDSARNALEQAEQIGRGLELTAESELALAIASARRLITDQTAQSGTAVIGNSE